MFLRITWTSKFTLRFGEKKTIHVQKVLVRSNLQIRTSTSGWNNYLHALFCKYVQAHLAGIILVTKSLNLIGNTWFYDLEQLQNTSPTNQKSTEAIFLQFETTCAERCCSENNSVTMPAAIQEC